MTPCPCSFHVLRWHRTKDYPMLHQIQAARWLVRKGCGQLDFFQSETMFNCQPGMENMKTVPLLMASSAIGDDWLTAYLPPNECWSSRKEWYNKVVEALAIKTRNPRTNALLWRNLLPSPFAIGMEAWTMCRGCSFAAIHCWCRFFGSCSKWIVDSWIWFMTTTALQLCQVEFQHPASRLWIGGFAIVIPQMLLTITTQAGGIWGLLYYIYIYMLI